MYDGDAHSLVYRDFKFNVNHAIRPHLHDNGELIKYSLNI